MLLVVDIQVKKCRIFFKIDLAFSLRSVSRSVHCGYIAYNVQCVKFHMIVGFSRQ